MNDSNDFDLGRFVKAQTGGVYETALGEIRSGKKRGHWIWFIFPQMRGLGMSETSNHFGISGREEAVAYLAHPILGPRLLESTTALLAIKDRTMLEVFGKIDSMKVNSSMTLFAETSAPSSIFEDVLERRYAGSRCKKTIEMLAKL